MRKIIFVALLILFITPVVNAKIVPLKMKNSHDFKYGYINVFLDPIIKSAYVNIYVVDSNNTIMTKKLRFHDCKLEDKFTCKNDFFTFNITKNHIIGDDYIFYYEK